MASITAPEYPGERLMVCRNPELARLRAARREDLLKATERDLAPIRAAVQRARNPLRGKAAIALKVGAVLNRHKMAKHFEIAIEDDRFAFSRIAEAIARETALDGVYVVRTSLPTARLDDAATVAAYKRLSGVERAFRSLKTVDLEIRPIFHRASPRVRAHVLLCMLAYYVEHHMRERLAPLLYDDTDREAAARLRDSVVAKAQRSPPPGASKPSASPKTACRRKASRACSPTSPPAAACRRRPPSTKTTASPSTRAQPQPRRAPSNSWASTQTGPSNPSLA